MKKIYITVTGTNMRYGTDFLEKGMNVLLVKEPDNKWDQEAIKVMLEGLDLIGYVANSPKTVTYGNYSAGRIYDKIKDETIARVEHVLCDRVICSVDVKGS